MSRREFTKETRRDAHDRSGGVCECRLLHAAGIPGFTAEGCGQSLGDGNTFYEHINVDRHSKDNSLRNCAVLTKTCWKKKTATYDLPTIAKGDRQFDRGIGIRRGSGPPMPGSRASGWRRPMNAFRAERRL